MSRDDSYSGLATHLCHCLVGTTLVLTSLGCQLPDSSSEPRVSTPERRAHERAKPRHHPPRPDHALATLMPEEAQERPVPALGSDALLAWDERALLTDTASDTVHLVDTQTPELLASHTFARGASPGRLARTQTHAYVVLRGHGALAALDLQDLSPHMQARVCPAPRGVAADITRDRVWVACASGELVSLDPNTLEVLSSSHLDADLRDVVATPKGVFVSRFRAAEVLSIDPANGQISDRIRLRGTHAPGHAAWKMAQDPWGNVLVGFQQAVDAPLRVTAARPGGYASRRCNAPGVTAQTTLVRLQEGRLRQAHHVTQCEPSSAVPLDLGWRPCGEAAMFHGASVPGLAVDGRPGYTSARTYPGSDCARNTLAPTLPATAQLLAAGFDARGRALMLARDEHLSLHIDNDVRVTLDPSPPFDMGQYLFHASSGSGIACASCHPEGGDDGHVWRFEREDEREVVRRTQNLRGGIEGRLHWDGEFEDIDALMTDVFTTRMGGFTLGARDGQALRDWLNTLSPEPGRTPEASEKASVARGAALYTQAGCDGCHGGETLTDHAFANVGTGGVFKTPTLRGVSSRHKLMHDGCASTPRERFDPACGGDQHGDLEGMTSADLDDLSAYLETL